MSGTILWCKVGGKIKICAAVAAGLAFEATEVSVYPWLGSIIIYHTAAAQVVRSRGWFGTAVPAAS